MHEPYLLQHSLAGAAGVARAAMVCLAAAAASLAGALAAPSAKCADPQTENCDSLRPLADHRLKESLKKTLPGALSPLLEAEFPDLIVSARAEKARLERGESTGLRLILQNIGSAPADFGDTGAPLMRLLMLAPDQSVGGYLDDAGEDNGPEQLLEIKSPHLIAPRERVEESYTLAIASDSALGVYRLCAIADPEGVIRERNEENNQGCVDVTVSVAPDSNNTAAMPQLDIPAGKNLPRGRLTPLPGPAPERED